MVLVDTSVWIDHLRRASGELQQLLANNLVLSHPFIVGELAMGMLQRREIFLGDLRLLPVGVVAEHNEVLDFIHRKQLFGHGLGYVDAHLLVSARLTADAQLWTRDQRLHRVAQSFAISF